MTAFYLVHAEARRRAIEAVRTAPEGMVVRIVEPARNGEQNDKFHALCSDLANSGMQWMGKRRSKDEWKVLLVSGHAVVTKEGAEMAPGIEGEFVNLRESTARMGKRRMSSLIEYALAFVATHVGRQNVHCRD